MKRVNAREILAGPELHRKPMGSTAQGTEAQDEIGTAEAEDDRAYDEAPEGERAAFFALAKYRGSKDEPDRREEMFVRAMGSEDVGVRVDVAREDFAAIEGSPLSYKKIGLLSHVFRENVPLYPIYAHVAQGLVTGGDERFVQYFWELPRNQENWIEWIPFAKGGEFRRFYGDIYLVVQWNEHSRRAMGEFGRVQNVDWFFKSGITYTYVTIKGFNARYLPNSCIFGHAGNSIFPTSEIDSHSLLGVLDSALGQALLNCITDSRKYEVGYVRNIPVCSVLIYN